MPIVYDGDGNIFYQVNLDNGIIFSSAHFVIGDELNTLYTVNNHDMIFGSVFIIIMSVLITLAGIKIFDKIRNKKA